MQLFPSSTLEAFSALMRLVISYALDWLIRATIAIIPSIILLLAHILKTTIETVRKRKLRNV